MKITFITTVLNEENGIKPFLDSLDVQTKKPDEIIVVDAYSSDNTQGLIKKHNLGKRIKLFSKKGNRSIGRNFAIKHASGDIIAVSDVGCILDKNWLKNIVGPFKTKSIDVVAGFYKPLTNTVFEKSLATYTCTMPDKVRPDDFLPSSRSVAFRKDVWKRAGGYPEDLNTCEDLVFDKKLKQIGAQFHFAKDAIVVWPQRKNIIQAFKQFFSYAVGEGDAFYIRPNSLFLYARYIVGVLSLIYVSAKHNYLLFTILQLLFILYLVWAVVKNYIYVRNVRALLYLPMLQIVSDLAVILGNIFGFIKKRPFTIPIIFYTLVILSTINYGIPNTSHPFNYNMDEWHQYQAVRAVFKHFTPNIAGAAHGSIFHFVISGIFLVPFTILSIIDPFAIKSSVSNLEMQEKIFMILRLNTLLFGVASLILVALISKILKTSQFVAVALFASVPIWVILSNIFKYDIALIFWICLTIYFILRFGMYPTGRNFIIAAIPCGLAFATKVSGSPIFLLYIFSFFLFYKRSEWWKKLKYLVTGIIVYIAISLLLGVPDLLFGIGDYREFLDSNLLNNPEKYSIYNLGSHTWWTYLLFRIIPLVFGHGLYLLSFCSIIYLCYLIMKKNGGSFLQKSNLLIFAGFVFFVTSFYQLNLGATGNRLLVLLPFLILISSIVIARLWQSFKNMRLAIVAFLIVVVFVQMLESGLLVYSKHIPSVSQTSSDWILKNVERGTIIGVENPPIYQTQPDVVLSEYYLLLANKEAVTKYLYKAISSTDNEFPEVIVISERGLHEKHIKKSESKALIKKLREQGYKVIAEFHPPKIVYYFFGDELAHDLTGLAVRSPISIFKKE